jgi:peptidyl-prolyl cis-trans isomerase SurA
MKSVTQAVVAVAAALALSAPLTGAEIIEQVLVKVNGDIITKTDLERRQIDALRQRMNAQVNPEALRTDEQLQKALAEVTPPLLVDAIDDLLMIQLAREKGFKLPDEAFNRWLTNMRKEQNLVDDQKFEAALKQEGMTMTDLRRNVERQFMIQEVQRAEVGSKLQITEAEARQYYQSHQQEFVTPSSVTLREILIEAAADPQGTRDPESVKEQAAAVRARIAGGEDFAKVAAEVSAAPSKANGGLVGPIVVSELSQALQDVLGRMKPGDVTEPIRGARGYQIVKLETHTAVVVQPFDSVRDLVAERVYSQRQRTEVQKFLSRIRSQAIIIWKNDELKQAYERQIASMQTASSGNQ